MRSETLADPREYFTLSPPRQHGQHVIAMIAIPPFQRLVQLPPNSNWHVTTLHNTDQIRSYQVLVVAS